MGSVLGATVDFVHALLMAAWVLGMPLLFWSRWPRLSHAYAIYSIVFIVVNQLSMIFLGECILTTVARACWRIPGTPVRASEEWFTVRMAEAIFSLTPSHKAIKLVSKALILLTAIGVVFRGVARRRTNELSKATSPK